MAATLLAHAGPGLEHGSEIALGAIAVAAMVIPLIVLVYVARIFLRADEGDGDAKPQSPPPTEPARAPRPPA
jgi:uncharacterized membrane protein YhiD involved in acid resistance